MTLQASWKSSQCSLESIQNGLKKLGEAIGMEIRVRFTTPNRRQRCAIFVTRETHCLEALMAEFKSGRIKNVQPVVIISNRGDLAPLAKKFGLPFFCIPWEERNRAEADTLAQLDKFEVDFVVLARFMKILSPNFVWRFKNKIINMHTPAAWIFLLLLFIATTPCFFDDFLSMFCN